MALQYYLILSALLFTIGVIGVLIRRNAIIIFMCIELMLKRGKSRFCRNRSRIGRRLGTDFRVLRYDCRRRRSRHWACYYCERFQAP